MIYFSVLNQESNGQLWILQKKRHNKNNKYNSNNNQNISVFLKNETNKRLLIT
jgi:hypothetical protein